MQIIKENRLTMKPKKLTKTALTANAFRTLNYKNAARIAVSMFGLMILILLSAATGRAQQFCNSTSISIPNLGAANPYPSNITVNGLSGSITNVTVTLNNIQHSFSDDIDILLVSPTGQKFIILSDVGGGNGFTTTATITLSDAATQSLPLSGSPIASGTYRPTNEGTDDTFSAPAPAAPYQNPAPAGGATFASVFGGNNPNGVWSLYVVDDASSDYGSISGGWCLNLTTTAPSPGQFQFTSSNFTGEEAAGAAAITVTRTGGFGTVSVDYTTSDGTATGGANCTSGVDYINTSGTISFADGETGTRTFTVQICPDSVIDPNENVNLQLSNPMGGATLGTPNAATLIIGDSVSFTVDTISDDATLNACTAAANDCSLRGAIANANGTATSDAINFDAAVFASPQTIVLTNGELTITNNGLAAINGTGERRLTISGNNTSRVFFVNDNAQLKLGDLKVANGTDAGDYAGGGISNGTNSRLTLTNVVVSDNFAILGGGIYNDGILTITNSTISNNTASDGSGRVKQTDLDENIILGLQNVGGGISNFGTLTMTGSIVSGNSGSGIFTGGSNGSATITNSTISGNITTGTEGFGFEGGGGIIVNFGNILNLTNVTVTGNRAADSSCTVCAGGIRAESNSTLNLKNTIVANNTDAGSSPAPDLRGAVSSSSSYNLIGNNQGAAGITNGTNGNQVGTNAAPIDPLLAPLGDYGGMTFTHIPFNASTAIDAGDPASVLTTDQRGAMRPFNSRADIGAVEVNTVFIAVLPNATTRQSYNETLVPDNGATNYAVTSGQLPPGLTLTTNFTPSAVVAITGTPTTGGTYNFAITGTNGSNSETTSYQINILSPTAASVSVSGRVLTDIGRGLTNASVVLTDKDGNTRTARTSSFGYYRFADVAAGETYILNVRSKRYQFLPQVVSVTEDLTELNFTAQASAFRELQQIQKLPQ